MGGILSGAANALLGAGSSLLPSGLRELARELRGRLRKAPLDLNAYGYDPYGFHPDQAWRFLIGPALMYRHYFRVETQGIERVPTGGVLLIGNHAGQFAYDGAMAAMAMLLEAEPPRLARGMGEYFLWKVPWMGIMASRIGTMVGTPENCVAMLEAGECVMAFPEGARGANKPFHKRYQLQRFGLGFMRLALQTGVPIVPMGIVGSEEQQPGFANLEGVAERLGLPSLPITVTQPWLGPVGSAMALPVKYHIYFGDPLYFEGEAHDEDAAIEARVEVVKQAMLGLLDRGRRERTGIFQ
jgi:1-acyl-sn-glycerol-3-phosphate acyltransferase